MIERLDSHDKHRFSTVYGQQPYESKWSVPCFIVKTAETVNSVRSQGLTAYWYRTSDGAENSVDTAYSGFLPGGIVNIYYPNGLPDMLSASNNDGWSLALLGSFKPEFDGDYIFYFGGDGIVSSFSVGSDTVDRTGSNIYIKLSDSDHYYGNKIAATMTAGQWYDISIKYKYQGELDHPAGLVCLYQNDNTSDMPDKLVLSAGVTAPLGVPNIADEMPILAHTVNAVSDIKLNMRKDGADVFTFKVPFVSSASTYTWDGFFRRSPYEYYSTANDIRLKKFDMIEFHEGYWTTCEAWTESTSRVAETVQKFSGQIRDFNIHYSQNGNDYLEVICASYEIFLKDSFVIDQPNYMDYITAGYMTDIPGHVNGETRPRAYDGWELYKAYENLLLNAYIDPVLTRKKEKRNGWNNQEVTGSWFIDQIDQSDVIYLANEKDYGRPMVLEDDDDPDAKYNYSIDTGEYIYDAIDYIMEPYGFEWGINRTGYAFMSGIDTPSKIIHSTTYIDTEDAWINPGACTVVKDFDSIKACYLHTTTSLTSISTNNFYAQRIDAIINVSPRGNSNALYLSVNTAGGSVDSPVLDTQYDTAWAYYKGVDPNTGVNPCILTVSTNLPYDEYNVNITCFNALSYDIDSLLLYDRDINTPVFYFKTSDEASPGHVVALDVKDTTNDMRNDCIVLGRRTGTKTGIDFEGNLSNINPNNPVLTFYQSRTIDVNSIHSASAVNYAGRPLQTIIVDDKIANQSQADYVSFNFIEDHRVASKEITFKTIGHPLIEINDCIAVVEEFKDGLTATKKLWITDIQTNYSPYITTFKATDRQPYASYRVKTAPDLELFDNNPFWNVRVENGGTVGRLYNFIGSSDTTIYMNTSLAYCAQPGYFMIKTDYDDDTNTEIIFYDSISSAAGVWYFENCVRGLQGTDARTWWTTNVVVAGYDPYMQDGMNIVPKVTFDLVKSGYLQLQINCIFNGKTYQLTTLTDHGNKVGGWPIYGREYVEWGKDVYFTWNGNDDIGRWNDFAATHNKGLDSTDRWPSENIEGGFFTIEPKETRYTQVYPEFNLSVGDNTTPFVYPGDETPDYFYIRRGICSTAVFQIDYSNVYYTGNVSEWNSLCYYCPDWQTDRSTLIDNTDANASYATSGGITDMLFPVYIRTDPNATIDGSKVKFTIKDRTAESQTGDNYFQNRKYRLHIVAHILRVNFAPNFSDNLEENFIEWEDNESIIIDDNAIERILYNSEFLTDGLVGYFNPKDYPDKFKFYNSDFNQKIKERGGSDLYLWWNVIYFSGYIMDKSGRKCFQQVYTVTDEDVIGRTFACHYGNKLNGQLYNANDSNFKEGLWNWDRFLHKQGGIIGWVDKQLSGGYYPLLELYGIYIATINDMGTHPDAPLFISNNNNAVIFIHGDSEVL